LSQEDYETQFPALSSKTFPLTVPTVELPQLRYSEIAARQFEIVSMTPNATEEAIAPLSATSIVPSMKKNRDLSQAVRSWVVGSNRPLTSYTRPHRVPKTFIRTSFDKLFCSTKQETLPAPAVTTIVEKPQIVSLLRFSLSKVNNTQLLLPDYHLNRLIQSNPDFTCLIQQPKRQQPFKSKRL
jgi:hypothetical protein